MAAGHDSTHVLLGLLFLAGLSTGVSAKESRCEDKGIVTQDAEPQGVKDGCEAVKSAARFFESSAVSMPENVGITIVDGQPTPFSGVHETGNCDSRQNLIRVPANQPAVKATKTNEPGLAARSRQAAACRLSPRRA